MINFIPFTRTAHLVGQAAATLILWNQLQFRNCLRFHYRRR